MGPQTAVTSAPYDVASCTAYEPTPPEAPITSTRWPACTRPWSRTAWSAVLAETGTAAASAKLSPAGLATSPSATARVSSASAPCPAPTSARGAGTPMTSSPTAKRVTPSPTASTTPGQLAAGDGAARAAQAEHHPADQGQPGHQVHGAALDAGGPDPDQDLPGSRLGRCDVRDPELLHPAVPVLDDCLHDRTPLRCKSRRPTLALRRKSGKQEAPVARPNRPALTRDAVLDAAVGLADRDGLAALSMRSLARHLGIEAMSLYHHVANKDALLDGMVDVVFGEIHLPGSVPTGPASCGCGTCRRARC